MFEQAAAMARALGSPHHLELIELLAQAERSVEELVRLNGLSIANASQHLQRLRRFGLVEARPDGA
jgi:DNA-binding transcriptional ArsR family regulator